MNGNEHNRAIDLLTRRDIEGIADGDAQWLEMHLQECEECASVDRAMSGTARAVRSVTVMASASLVEATRNRVHVRAEQLQERESRRFLVAISFAMGVVFSTASAWAWWKVGGWMVERWSLPASFVGPGMVVAWLLPAMCLGAFLVTFPNSSFEDSVMQSLLKERQKGTR
jgi:hypothetical protein